MRAFQQSLFENGYSRQEELTFWDCDRRKRMRMSALLSKLAVFAGFDYDARGLTHEKLWQLREVFLLSRVALRLRRVPTAGEVLTVSTWEDGVRGAHMRRVYELRDDSGAVLGGAKTDWILADPVSRKVLRPASFTARGIHLCPREIDSPEPKRLRLPPEGAEELGSHRVAWSELDGNGHLFSGNYGDIIWDALPEDLRERTPQEFFLNYSREAVLGEELRLLGRREGSAFLVEGLGPEGTCFTARCLFAEDYRSGPRGGSPL